MPILQRCPNKHADSIKGRKEFHDFRMLLKKHVAEYKEAIGEELGHNDLKEIFWEVMDNE